MPFLDQAARSGTAVETSAGPHLISRQTRAMASIVTVHVPAGVRDGAGDAGPGPGAGAGGDSDTRDGTVGDAIIRALEEFHLLERACTRFDPASPLMRANRDPRRWHRAPEALFATLAQAARSHRRTGGLYDPRVHDRLNELGYDRSFHLIAADPAAGTAEADVEPRPPARAWRPLLVPGLRLVRLGPSRIDLGGVGKGVALARAASRLREATPDFLIDAGGDIYASGHPRRGEGWKVGVESPCGSPGPVAVLEVEDRAVATSSIRVRQWRSGNRTVHHLIDPRTGQPGGEGLAAVTVIHEDPVAAETWAKALFLAGAGAIAEQADATGLPALWVDRDDRTGMTPAIMRHVIWSRR